MTRRVALLLCAWLWALPAPAQDLVARALLDLNRAGRQHVGDGMGQSAQEEECEGGGAGGVDVRHGG